MTVSAKQPLSGVANGSFVIMDGDTSEGVYQKIVPDTGLSITGGAAGSIPLTRQPDGLLRVFGATTWVIVVSPVFSA